jgi:hypothetical protein
MQTGEVLRRVAFDLLDAAKGGRLKKLKECFSIFIAIYQKLIICIFSQYLQKD